MSNALKVGDRAKIVRDTDGRIYNGIGIPFVHYQDLYGREVEVLSVDERWGNAVVRIKEGIKREIDLKCLERINPPRRTFEEICKELAENAAIKGKWNPDYNYAPRTVLLTNEKGIMLHIYDDGEVRFEPDIENGGYHSDIFTAAQLAAIAAACSEIAANYQAEHGKENQQ